MSKFLLTPLLLCATVVHMIPLRDAILCTDCNWITESRVGCARCGSGSVLSLSKVLDREAEMRIGYVVGYMGLEDVLPEFSGAAFDGKLDAEKEATRANERYSMLKHKVYELHEVENA